MEAEDYLDRENQIQLQEKEHFRHMNALEVQYASDILESRTLDRFHYETLEDTRNRDKDQVVYRYTKRQKEKENQAQVGKEGSDSVNRGQKDEQKSEQSRQGERARKGSDTAENIQEKNKEGINGEKDGAGVDDVRVNIATPEQRRTKLLMVSQLWLWQIDSRKRST
jgi:hypothetical protein